MQRRRSLDAIGQNASLLGDWGGEDVEALPVPRGRDAMERVHAALVRHRRAGEKMSFVLLFILRVNSYVYLTSPPLSPPPTHRVSLTP